MSKANNTSANIKNQSKYHHLTKEDRIKIEILSTIYDENNKRVYNNTYIAMILNVHNPLFQEN